MSFENGVFIPEEGGRGGGRGGGGGRSFGGRRGGGNRRGGRGRGRGFNYNPNAPVFQPSSSSSSSSSSNHIPSLLSSNNINIPVHESGVDIVEPPQRNNLSSSSSQSSHNRRGNNHQDHNQFRYRNGRRSRGGNGSHDQSHWQYSRGRKQRNGDTGEGDGGEERIDVTTGSSDKEKDVNGSPTKTGQFERASKPDARNQRERLMDQLTKNAYDCMICVERVRWNQQVWSCKRCFNVFHLKCVGQWAKSSLTNEEGWRCPGCQVPYLEIPKEYWCFCGKVKNPDKVRSDIPHACGSMCGRTGIGGEHCSHSCGIKCHPGPCPSCETIENRKCCCGKTAAQVKCGSKSVLTCRNLCEKTLNCGGHHCKKTCHAGDCDSCEFVIDMECHCGTEKKMQICDPETSGVTRYSCGKECNRLLSCGKHRCSDKCHPGPCQPCALSPQMLKSCPCGKTPINLACSMNHLPQRKTCLDRVPECNKTCERPLTCGGIELHKCSAKCHLNPICPPCPRFTKFGCQCGSKTFEIKCSKFNQNMPYECEKRCIKRKSCGKHKCNAKCCTDPHHICMQICNRPLTCGNHNCEMLCHGGHCRPCGVLSFEELSCECGETVIYPPVPCGTRPPICPKPCRRQHSCNHPVLHNCHSAPDCPPCIVLTEKWCHGRHELRKNVPCHIETLSCGTPCLKPLPCSRHLCPKNCHPGSCLEEGEACQLVCTISRQDCGHQCGAPCHVNACPSDKCKVVCEVTCPCQRKRETMICWKREKEYDKLVCFLTNMEVRRLEGENANNKESPLEINRESILEDFLTKTPKSSVLECDKECARVERNKKLLEALNLDETEHDSTSTFGAPNYSEFLQTYTKSNPQFAENIHARLTTLVEKAKRISHKKNESYGFEAMKRDKRRFIHEYSDHFGCLSESFDEEPNRNVICFASKDKCYIPSVSIIDVVFRPKTRCERKDFFSDVEIVQDNKTQILRPANGKISWGANSRSTTAIHASSNASSSSVPVIRPATTVPIRQTVIPNADFPPLN